MHGKKRTRQGRVETRRWRDEGARIKEEYADNTQTYAIDLPPIEGFCRILFLPGIVMPIFPIVIYLRGLNIYRPINLLLV